jgi:uncharacterized protein YcbX
VDEVVGTVAELWRHPVKSMGGERLAAARAGLRGLAGDRGWAIVDAETGHVASAKRPRRWGPLLDWAAAYAEEPEPDGPPASVRITLPDDSEVRSDDPACDRLLSRALGLPVTLLSSAPEGATYEVERDEAIVESRVGGLAPAGTFFDSSTLHVLARAPRRALGRAALPAQRPRGPRRRRR